MKVTPTNAVPQQPVDMQGSDGCSVRQLLGEQDGAPTFAMREFEVNANGHTPKHSHDYEHEVYVLAGEGVVLEGEQEHKIKAGDVVLVQPNEIHQFRNTGDQPLKFLCLIPNSAAGKNVTVAPECGVESE